MKTMKYFLFFSLFILNSCGKIECPAFDSSLLWWLPHSINDKLIYVNQNSDTLKFVVTAKNISDSYKIKHNCKCDCESHADLKAIRDVNKYDAINISISQSDLINDTYNTSLFMYTININNDQYGNLSFSTNNINNEIKDTTINSKAYKIIVITRDTLDNNYEIWKLIHAKDVGIIKMYNRKTKDEWTLVE